MDRLPGWRNWTARIRAAFGMRPVRFPFLATPERLVALARSVFRDGVVPPYEIGGAAVTEVTPIAGTSEQSHSQNDRPAPPHTAGFFEPDPPDAVFFACLRPHPGGGGETTVCDVERILSEPSPEHRRMWETHPYRYRTSARLGRTEHPLRILRGNFLRYRREYMITDDAGREALDALSSLVEKHRFVFPLAAGETLLFWNGAPHGRLPQIGPTPDDPARRRLLLRCRVHLPGSPFGTFRKEGALC